VKTFAKNFYSLKKGPSIIDITKVDVFVDWKADIHTHPWTEISFISRGSGRILIGNTIYSHLRKE
jgi:hypothetical protein